MIRTAFRPLLPLVALAWAAAAPAQTIAYPGIAWNTPADSARAHLEAAGLRRTEVLESGDQVYRSPDNGWLRLTLREGRVLGVMARDTTGTAGLDTRFAVLADSLRAALGAPDDSVPGSRPERRWVLGLTSLSVGIEGVRPNAYVQTQWMGPGWYDEMTRRQGAPELPAGFTTVDFLAIGRIAVDTAASGRRVARGLLGRFRIEYDQPITPSLNGVDQPPMDAVEYEMELDCTGRRARLIARSTFLEGRRLMSERPDTRAWSTPAPDGHYARGLDAVCRTYR